MRLKANKPTILPKDFAINNDSRALVAGPKWVLIKQSRYITLEAVIDMAVQQAEKMYFRLHNRFKKARNKTKTVKSNSEQLKEDYKDLLKSVLRCYWKILRERSKFCFSRIG